jgi:hypothetical protein
MASHIKFIYIALLYEEIKYGNSKTRLSQIVKIM